MTGPSAPASASSARWSSPRSRRRSGWSRTRCSASRPRPGPAQEMAELVSVEEHLERILAAVAPLPDFPQPLLDALGLPAAEDVVSPIPLPSFDNSAMDGYAVVAADVASATEDDPVWLPVVGEIGAGQASLLALSPGTAAKIMTGAPVPKGCDAVVPYEWTDRGVAKVRITQAPAVGQHLRHVGEDVAEGDLLVERGTVLGPRHLGLLASVGRATVRARPRPRVVVISTGSELREPGRAWATTRSTTATPTCSPPPPGRPARSPTGSASSPTSPRRSSTRCPTSWSAPTWWSPRAASRRATSTSSRRRWRRWARCGSAGSRCSRASRRASASSAGTARPGSRSSRCPATRCRRTSPSSSSCCPPSAR